MVSHSHLSHSYLRHHSWLVCSSWLIYIICLTWSVTHICHIATCDTIRDTYVVRDSYMYHMSNMVSHSHLSHSYLQHHSWQFLFEVSFWIYYLCFGHICHTTRAANNTPPPWAQTTTSTATRDHHNPKNYYPRPCSWHSTYYPTATLLPAQLPPSPSLRSKAFSQSAYASTGAHSQKSDT